MKVPKSMVDARTGSPVSAPKPAIPASKLLPGLEK
jgi:hypothetical protein